MLQENVELCFVGCHDLLFVSVHFLNREVVCLLVDSVASTVKKVNCEVGGCCPRALSCQPRLSAVEEQAIGAAGGVRPVVPCRVVAVQGLWRDECAVCTGHFCRELVAALFKAHAS